MKKLKAGDLLRLKDGSGVVGLILGPGYVSPVMRGVETMNILWSDDTLSVSTLTIPTRKPQDSLR